MNWSRLVPYAVAAAAALYLVVAALPPGDTPDAPHVQAFGRLPVQDGGRVKPLDTVARNSLMGISDRSEVIHEDNTTEPADKWLLDLMTGKGLQEKVIRIDNDETLALLGLPQRPGSFRYSIEELRDKFREIGERADEARARRKEGGKLDLVDEKVIALEEHLGVYLGLANMMSPRTVPAKDPGGNWLTLRQAIEDEAAGGDTNRPAEMLGTALMAYAKNDTDGFNRGLAEYRRYLEKEMPGTLQHTDFEFALNHFTPFVQCAALYLVALLLVCVSWVVFSEPLRGAAFGLLVVTLVVHTAALVSRMYLMDRWLVLVTNLYSSAVAIGWAACLLGLILERIFGYGIGCLVASVVGFVTMIIAHNLGFGEDTLEMMRAVLDTNFWLATHVTCVTLGYAATFVAGLLGIVLIAYALVCRLGNRAMERELFVALGWALYGVLCFATLLSFTGTVLGGIWADQSWGRFWGWDPKENGALIIVLWNALILHARWAGLVKQRGMAVLAVFGNVVTSWSWFGVNMLNVGLHSYGFMQGAQWWLGGFDLSQVGLILVGVLPLGAWGNLTAPRPKLPPLAAAPAPRLRHKSTHVAAAR